MHATNNLNQEFLVLCRQVISFTHSLGLHKVSNAFLTGMIIGLLKEN